MNELGPTLQQLLNGAERVRTNELFQPIHIVIDRKLNRADAMNRLTLGARRCWFAGILTQQSCDLSQHQAIA
jgi:hypothetical protein